MLYIEPPTSNTERQRQFRERNPGYYNRYNAQRRAQARAAAQAFPALWARLSAAQPEVLMLPAPVEVLEIPGINAIPAVMPSRDEAVTVARD